MLDAIRGFDTLGRKSLNTVGLYGHIFFAKCLEVSVTGRWPTAADREIFGHDQISDLWLRRESRSHIALSKLTMDQQLSMCRLGVSLVTDGSCFGLLFRSIQDKAEPRVEFRFDLLSVCKVFLGVIQKHVLVFFVVFMQVLVHTN